MIIISKAMTLWNTLKLFPILNAMAVLKSVVTISVCRRFDIYPLILRFIMLYIPKILELLVWGNTFKRNIYIDEIVWAQILTNEWWLTLMWQYPYVPLYKYIVKNAIVTTRLMY